MSCKIRVILSTPIGVVFSSLVSSIDLRTKEGTIRLQINSQNNNHLSLDNAMELTVVAGIEIVIFQLENACVSFSDNQLVVLAESIRFDRKRPNPKIEEPDSNVSRDMDLVYLNGHKDGTSPKPVDNLVPHCFECPYRQLEKELNAAASFMDVINQLSYFHEKHAFHDMHRSPSYSEKIGREKYLDDLVGLQC